MSNQQQAARAYLRIMRPIITRAELMNAVYRSAEREYHAWCANQF